VVVRDPRVKLDPWRIGEWPPQTEWDHPDVTSPASDSTFARAAVALWGLLGGAFIAFAADDPFAPFGIILIGLSLYILVSAFVPAIRWPPDK
jgi:hypothetical protein